MNLTRAIEILYGLLQRSSREKSPDSWEALRLGQEALKWRQLMERDYGSWCGPLLPGETPE